MTFNEYYEKWEKTRKGWISSVWKNELRVAFNAGIELAGKTSQEKILAESFKQQSTTPEVIYSERGEFYEVRVTFNRSLSYNEKLQVGNVIEYWGSIPYCGEYLGIEWLNNHVALVSQDITKSASDDWGCRNVLELLLEYLQNGTPIRTTNKSGVNTKGTRAVNGLKNVVLKIEGV